MAERNILRKTDYCQIMKTNGEFDSVAEMIEWLELEGQKSSENAYYAGFSAQGDLGIKYFDIAKTLRDYRQYAGG